MLPPHWYELIIDYLLPSTKKPTKKYANLTASEVAAMKSTPKISVDKVISEWGDIGAKLVFG